MPKLETLRIYYPNSTMTDDELNATAEWVRCFLNREHISPDNLILTAMVALHEDHKNGRI